MIELFFGLNIGMAFITLLTISMLNNHFQKIDKWIDRYADKKAYKQQEDMRFVNLVLERYEVITSNQGKCIDVGILVKKTFYEEKIGKFRYTLIESIALRGKILMWAILFGQIGIELIGKVPAYPKRDVIMIIANTLICMIITLVGVIRGLVEERERVLSKIEDYIVNTYPAEIQWEKNREDVKKLYERIEYLQGELQGYQQRESNVAVETEKETSKEKTKEFLKEKDIISLLEKFNLIG